METVLDVMDAWIKNAACAICAKEFKDWNLYKDHMQAAHSKDLMKVGNSSNAAGQEIAFVYCATCDESIDAKRISEHKKDGHKVEVTYKNDVPKAKTGSKCSQCKHQQDSHMEDGCQMCDCSKGYAQIVDADNATADDDDEELKKGLEKSMSEPAKAVKNMLESAVQNGMLSGADMQKLVTRDGFPKTSPPIKFLMPGLVEYEYMNNGEGARVLVTKNAIDKMLSDPEKSIVGKPVINLAHRDVSPDDYKNGKADGVVTRAWWDPQEAWFCCEALVWDEDTRQNLMKQAVSCEYTALPPWGPAGTLNQVAYDKEVTDGRFKHLAVVAGPRYEGAKLMNSTGGTKTMKLLQWLKRGNEEVRNSVEVDAEQTVIVGEDGKQYPLSNAIQAIKEQEEAQAKAEALKNAKVLGDSDTVTINGKVYTGADLKHAMTLSNADDKDDDKDDKDKKDKKEDAKNSDDEDDKKKKEKEKDDEAKNAVLMNSAHRLGQHIAPNEKCSICDGIQADRLQNAARMREGKLPTPVVPSIDDGLRRGRQMMGQTRAQQEAAAAAKQ